MNDHQQARLMATDWLEYDPEGNDGESAYERAKGNLARCYLEVVNQENVSTRRLVSELVRRGWRRYGKEEEWTHQRIVEMRENVALGDEILVAPTKENERYG